MTALLGIFALFAAVIVFGLNTILGGAWMLIAGKRNRFLLWMMWTLLTVLLVGGGVLRVVLD